MQTELELFHWRHGSAQAERLAGGILELEGYEAIDPQCPLGGPDGLKDLLCRRAGARFVAATYFPPTPQEFKAVHDKFQHDLEGVTKNSAKGIAFITNQRLTPGERNTLIGGAGEAEVDLFHLERVRNILDSPRGYGLRLLYLRLAMTPEDQIAFFASWTEMQARTVASFSRAVKELTVRVDALATTISRSQADPRRETIADDPSETPPVSGLAGPAVSGALSVPMLCAVHRALALGEAHEGRLRTVPVWVGMPGSPPGEARFIPAPAEKVPQLIANLLTKWNDGQVGLVASSENVRIDAIVEFHHRFLTIHPFTDGNGRIARFLLALQLEELCQLSFAGENLPPPEYARALVRADAGDLVPLKDLVKSLVEAEDTASE